MPDKVGPFLLAGCVVGLALLGLSFHPLFATPNALPSGSCPGCLSQSQTPAELRQDDGSVAGHPQQPVAGSGGSPPTLDALGWTGLVLLSSSMAVAVFRTHPRLPRRPRGRILPIVVLAILVVSGTSTVGPALVAPSSASSSEPSSDPVAYQSDFTHGYPTGWFVQPGTNSLATVGIVSDGGTQVLAASAHGAESAIVFYNGGEDWQNASVTATFKGVNGTMFDLFFCDQLIVATHSTYDLNLDLGAQVVRLWKSVGTGTNPQPTVSTLSTANYTLSLDVWYAISVSVTGKSIQAWLNGTKVVSATDPSPLLYGTLAFNARDVHGAYHVKGVSVTAQVPSQSTWQQLGGPDGGQIQAIDVDPRNTSVVYAGDVHTGVMKSDNRGAYWREVGFSNGMTGTKANVVLVAPSNSSVVYASLEDSSTGGGAYRSDDGGLHWRPLSQGLTGYFVDTMAVDPANPNTVYLATENLVGSSLPVGLERSVDGGNTYSNLLSAQVDTIAISKSNPSTIYVGTLDQGILRSDDGGKSWRNVTPAGFQGQPFNRVLVDPTNPNIAIAHQGVVNLGGRTCGGILRSTDGGNTWNVISGSMPYFGDHPCSHSGGLNEVAQSPSNPATLYAAGNYQNGTGVYLRSDDSGATWRMLNGRMAVPPEVIRVDPTDPDIAYVGTFGDGIYRTTDGGASLVHLLTGFTGGGVYALAVLPGNSNVIFASRSINGFGETANNLGTLAESTDGGDTWVDRAGPPYNVVDIEIDPSNPSTMYVATSGSPVATGSGVWKSTDGGATWAQKNQGLTYPNVTAIAISPSDTKTLLVGTGHRPYGGTAGAGIFKSTDGGDSWHKVNMPNFAVNRILIDPRNTNVMYAATFGGGVYKSTDGGEDWSQANTGIGSLYVYALAINPAQPDVLYAGVNPFYADPSSQETINAVFKSSDGAASWNLVLQDMDVEWILLDPGNPQNVYEGNHGGYVSWSADGGSTWTYGTEMLRKLGGHAYMWAATTDPGRRALLVGLCGRGTFINRLSAVEVQTPSWLKIPYGGKSYSSTFLSNSSLTDFTFSQTTGSFVYTVAGGAGSKALTNVSIPSDLITPPYSVSLDGSTLSPLSTRSLPAKNATQIVVSYTLSGTPDQLVVRGGLVSTTTTSSTTVRSSTSGASSSSTLSGTSSSSLTLSSTSTLASSTRVSSSSSSTTPSTTGNQVPSSTATSSGSGIPEFPAQALLLPLFSMLIVVTYAMARRRRPRA